jgi:hypothetical protein
MATRKRQKRDFTSPETPYYEGEDLSKIVYDIRNGKRTGFATTPSGRVMTPLETSLGVESPDSKYQRKRAAEQKRKVAKQKREKRKREKVKK